MLKVSKGNSKLGAIYNINMPAVVTCAPGVPCKGCCYARKGNYGFSNVKACYMQNYETYLKSPELAENDILLQLPHIDSKYTTLYTRWHSSGDIVDMRYLHMMVSIAKKRPFMKFLAFTKKYDIVNQYIAANGFFPVNLTIVFSHWTTFPMDNPYNMPVAVVKEYSDINLQGFECTGKCETCYHCWSMSAYGKVVFKKH